MFSSPSSGPGRALTGTGSLSHAGLLQTGPAGYMALTCRHGFPRLDGEMHPSLPFTRGFIFSELPEKPANMPHLRIVGQGLYFIAMIIWLQYSFPLWEPQMLSYELML